MMHLVLGETIGPPALIEYRTVFLYSSAATSTRNLSGVALSLASRGTLPRPFTTWIEEHRIEYKGA